MDKLSLLGIVIGLTGVLGGQWLEGGHISMLFQGTAFVIVFGGTIGAVMVQTPAQIFITALGMGRWLLFPPNLSKHAQIDQIVMWCTEARKGGLLSLEERIDTINDPYLQKGLQLLVDGNSEKKIRELMEVDNMLWEDRHWSAARVWEAAGGYSPTIGIIGAVLGLMHVMENLAEPSKVGGGIAVAFVATVYGVAFANLIYLPIAHKLKGILVQQMHIRDMVVDGLVGIANGENPRMVELKLESYIV